MCIRDRGYIEGINLLSSMRLCSNVPAQSLIPTALANLEDASEMVAPGGRIYEQREYIYNAIQDIPGLSAYKPKAAFYIFPKLDFKKFNICLLYTSLLSEANQISSEKPLLMPEYFLHTLHLPLNVVWLYIPGPLYLAVHEAVLLSVHWLL